METTIVLSIFSAVVATVFAQDYHGIGHSGIAQGHDHVASYQFAYAVEDPHTHDVHSQKELRHGKHVEGEYILKEADGTQRIVKYRAGPHSGFEAYVERHGHAQHPAVYGKYKGGKGEVGGTSYVSSIHWINQGHGGEHEGHY